MRRPRAAFALCGAALCSLACAEPAASGAAATADDTAATAGNVDPSSTGDDGPADADTSGGDTPGPIDPAWDRWEVRAYDYAVPTGGTTYVCFSFSVTVTEPRHIVAFEPVLDQAEVVHHMLLSRSVDPLGQLEPCYPGPPDSALMWGWGPGGGPLFLPDEAGFLAGAEPAELHYTLQIHYENPGDLEGLVDRSGVNVYSTTELRPQHASIAALGDVESLVIPPGQPDWPSAHYCGSKTTAALLGEPIQAFGSWAHAHELGRAVWTEHYRDGRRVGDLGRRDPYFFDDQHFEPIDVQVRPGDELRTFCRFDSTGQTEPVHGGGGTDDEMCLNYVLYYPAQPWFWLCND